MYKALENSLYMKNRERYEEIRRKANAFNLNYAGNNIIQDDIFHILENYVLQNDMHPELFRYPFHDDDFCACTFLRGGRVFVVINGDMPLSKEIFASAHELYHLYSFFEGFDVRTQEHPSILDSATMDDETTRLEDMEANAFAGAVLAPGASIREQMGIFRINPSSISIRDILMLMEIYAIPFKAVVLRLFEEDIIGEEKARLLFCNIEDDILAEIELTGRARRWQRSMTDEIILGSLNENMKKARRFDAVGEERYHEDMKRLEEIKSVIIRKR